MRCRIVRKNRKLVMFISILIVIATLLGLVLFLNIDKLSIERLKHRKITDEVLDYATTVVHFVDVGQGDGIVVENNGHYLVIDAGTNDTGKNMIAYLKSLKVDVIDVVIGTHPHEDHIGGLDDVINNFEVKKIYMPNFSATTRSYEDVLKAIKKSNLQISNPKVGTEFHIGTALVTIFAPVKKYSDANNNSIGVKIVDGDVSFVLIGDAEKIAEKDILNTGFNLSADVFKASHHGSTTSNTKQLLEAINPSIAIISAGKDNDYGYPHREIVALFKQMGITMYRTDESGTIVVSTNGKKIKVSPTID